MSSLDTNIVLRLVLDDIPDQSAKIISLIDKSKPNSLMVADAVFFECAWILSGNIYNFDRSLIGKLLMQVISIPQINCNRDILAKTIYIYKKHPTISFIDAFLSINAEVNNANPLLTFDKKLAKALPKAVNIL